MVSTHGPLCPIQWQQFLFYLMLRILILDNFYIHTVYHDTIKVFYLTTDAQLNCLKNNFKIHIKIDIKRAPTCFDVITIIR
jgi:hypothetical protein